MPILRRSGRPGLLGMAARTAVISGTATAVSGAVAQRQQTRAAEHRAMLQQESRQHAQEFSAPVAPAAPPATAPAAPSAAPSPAAAGSVTDVVAKLQQLGALHQQGLLSAEEFSLAKQQLLCG